MSKSGAGKSLRAEANIQIFVYVGGIRVFGAVEAEVLAKLGPIKVEVRLNDEPLLSEIIEWRPEPANQKRKIFVPEYYASIAEPGAILEARCQDSKAEWQLATDSSESMPRWFHVVYEIYAESHPNKHQQGLKILAHQHPQKFR